MIVQPKTDFKWGISTLGCHELDLPQICELAEKHGIHYLEIRSLADCLNLPEYLDSTYPEGVAAPAEILKRHRQSVIALNSGFNLIGADDAGREELLGFGRWAELLEIPYIRVFGGGKMDEEITDAQWAEAVESLNWWKSHAEKNNWKTRIALETHTGFSSSERCLKLQEAFGEPIDIIWDTHHTWKRGKESAQETWAQMSSMIKHVHIKDSVSVPSARHPYSYVLNGEGEFPAEDVFKILSENNYDGVVSLEWERKWHPYLPEIDAALDSLKTAGWRSESDVSATS